ncbi:MAG: tRNA (guanosine(46)-N7)-methyltransferase TrmB [Bacteroidales bacterium]|nr:tRNA (guanosine(46)-N7)-methyltransferase TrmB [Bacteroidales bacterium]MBO7764139.1 tRNA (guanosine(46)-N7)-methyltransferase TrmB [Bacteroidales bacterium]MBQ2242590.1 tRNA (guanosine(46)-N7)-methyltransferase TrmB [Bacteroidales bacterium]
MSGKDKIRKFRENLTFECLIQPTTEEVLGKDHPIKGHWHEKVFKNQNPIVLELGCGKGEYTIALSERYPDKNFIGVDIKGARLWKGAKYATENALPNVAFLRTRIEFITSLFAENEVSEIWVTFADPQPNKPKKRLTSHQFLAKYKTFLKPDGIIHLKTDSILLHESTLEVIKEGGHRLLEANNDIYAPESHVAEEITSIKTFYESQFLAKGMPITYLKFLL